MDMNNQFNLLSIHFFSGNSGVYGGNFSPEVQKAIEGAIFIANHLKQADESARVSEASKRATEVIDGPCLN